MNPYRIALILCRVVALDLWWNAAINLISSGLLALTIWVYPTLFTGLLKPLSNNYYQLGYATTMIIIAIFVGQFAPSLSAAAVGRGALEGDAIASRTVLEPHERALARIGAGLMLFFSGLSHALFATCWSAYSLFSDSSSTGVGRSILIYSAVTGLTPAFVRCAVGFVLAFQSGLRRMIKPAASDG